MDQSDNRYELRDYIVRVGHAVVKVQAATRDDVIRRAREQLCRELPRMWDVIHTLDDDRFQVAPASLAD